MKDNEQTMNIILILSMTVVYELSPVFGSPKLSIRNINESYCEATISKQIIRKIPNCDKSVKNCKNWITTVAPQSITKIICCSGYKNIRKKCIPKCDEACENSHCTGPNVCTCNQGYKNFSQFRCMPACDKCTQGLCVAPNICQCYRGYKLNDQGDCDPICENGCANGKCVEPNKCQCNSGYELRSNNTCYPICTNPCLNGNCIAPDICDCFPGYEFKSNSINECLPVCDFCESGNCTGPSKCTCWENYREIEILQNDKTIKICKPICSEECINGKCVEVNTCECNDGYSFVDGSISTCKPVCNPECVNADCIQPNKCVCHEGYRVQNETCQPVCDNPCKNGYCYKPNECQCFDQYQFNKITDQCEPICDETCVNGVCVSPNECECFENFIKSIENICEKMCEHDCIQGECRNGSCFCDDGYKLLEGNTYECIPYCLNSCINGICVSPNKCKCLEGFVQINDSLCERICEPECIFGICNDGACVCDDGYQLLENSTNECIPYCKKECINSNCTAPNKCTCFDHHERIAENICEKICEPKCIFGICRQGSCVCDESYRLLKDSTNECIPYCEKECINSNCTAPNECSCFDNYKRISEHFCEKICKPECIFGTCIDGECLCNKGYKMIKNSTHNCEPICELSPCINGVCVAPNVCNCFDGFEMSSYDLCEKICHPSCIFGECNNGNCICEEGFRLIENNTYECEPYCESSCINGTCIGNNTCVCENGLILNESNECGPSCMPQCQNGTCIAMNLCECWDGYLLSYHNSNECEPICGVDEEGCTFGTCIAPHTCHCFDGYKKSLTNEFVCEPILVTLYEADMFKVNYLNYLYVLLAASLILVCIILIVILRKKFRKIDYNVKTSERMLGVHYICSKEN